MAANGEPGTGAGDHERQPVARPRASGADLVLRPGTQTRAPDPV